MAMFTNDARQFKFDVLTEICAQCFNGQLDEDSVYAKTNGMVSLSGQRYRCCVYKEREILRQRARLSMGKMANEAEEYNPKQIVQVIDAACDGCTIMKIRVTDNCRKCMSKACQSACHFGAMSMGTDKAQIDYSKCKECGACARACPYNAIVVTERPCYAHCPVQAISWDENNIAVIDKEKCINCGQCELSCPFGAVEDLSFVVPVINLLKSDTPVYAIVAPSIQGQFEGADLSQIKKGIEQLGFAECLEVASGADAVAYYEAKELQEYMKEGKPMTTSCCTAFVNMQKLHFPEVFKENKSSLTTPMMALARKLKAEHPDYPVVFIGPCLAKKQEAMQDDSAVDYVLTYEELLAMLLAKEIVVANLDKEDISKDVSNYGRNFAYSGGVANAVLEAVKEMDGEIPEYVLAGNAEECMLQLKMIKNGKFTANMLEGMCCAGGCLGGPANLVTFNKAKVSMDKQNKENAETTITAALDKNSYETVNMEVNKQ